MSIVRKARQLLHESPILSTYSLRKVPVSMIRTAAHVADTRSIDRTYENAISLIETRQRRTRPNDVVANPQLQQEATISSGTPNLKGSPGFVGMSEWLEMMGYSDDDINALNVIHIAGTKGKGSTCAFTESFLRAHGHRTGYPKKTGMYTSPHLVVPEERIRINSTPLSQSLFAKYFFEVYDRLPQLTTDHSSSDSIVERGPRALQLYALLAFHVFIQEKVDVAIMETHSGGEYDATNVVKRPLVTAVTSLGMDHVQTLGPSIENIAWHKAGIYKQGACALSTLQDPGPSKVLEKRAREKGVSLRFVDVDARLPLDTLPLKPRVQKKNASLALAATNAFLDSKAREGSEELTSSHIWLGVEQWEWPGRFQIITDESRTWFLDAAHNEMSIFEAAQWFIESSIELNDSAQRVLIFAHTSEHRDGPALLRNLAEAFKKLNAGVDNAIFTTYEESATNHRVTKTSGIFRAIWREAMPDTQIWKSPTISEALQLARNLPLRHAEESMQILVTGSQHLIGPMLRLLQEV